MSSARSGFDLLVRNVRRQQLRRILSRVWSTIPGAKPSLELLREALKGKDEARRRRLLDSPLLGSWIHDVLFWMEVRDLSEALVTGRGTAATRTVLFDRIARSEFLTEMVPSGRLDARFAARCRKRAVRSLWEKMSDLPRILVPYCPPSRRIRAFPLFFRENTDEGCPPDLIRLGESPLALRWRGPSRPMALRALLWGGSLLVSAPVEMLLQETIPGSSILVSHRLISTPRALKVGPPVRGLSRRLARALALVDAAWPRAGEEIRRRTWLVVPLMEPGTVSYSLLARPGISYLNVFRGSLLDLADDLLHEAAHHRLHAWQETGELVLDREETRYYSPWRRTLRPIHGILHGTFTFLYRAELFLRMLAPSPRNRGPRPALGPGQRVWLRREARREIAACGAALADLERAAEAGLLTAPGARLAGRMRRRQRILRRGALSDKGLSSIL
jgi:hypothetical protein